MPTPLSHGILTISNPVCMVSIDKSGDALYIDRGALFLSVFSLIRVLVQQTGELRSVIVSSGDDLLHCGAEEDGVLELSGHYALLFI